MSFKNSLLKVNDTASLEVEEQLSSPPTPVEGEFIQTSMMNEQENCKAKIDSLFNSFFVQGILNNSFEAKEGDAMELEDQESASDTEESIPRTKEPDFNKTNDSDHTLKEVVEKVTTGRDSQKPTASTEHSSTGTQRSDQVFGDHGTGTNGVQYGGKLSKCSLSFLGHIQEEQNSSAFPQQTEARNGIQEEDQSCQKIVVPLDVAGLVQHEGNFASDSTREESSQGSADSREETGIHLKSKNIKKGENRKPQGLKKEPKPNRSSVYCNKIQYIAKYVLDHAQRIQGFQRLFRGWCKDNHVKYKHVERYLLVHIKGSKADGKTRTGRPQQQAKIANLDDVKMLLHEGPNDAPDLAEKKRGARLAFEVFFTHGFYEKFVQEKVKKLGESENEEKRSSAQEILNLFIEEKDEICRVFLPDYKRNVFLENDFNFNGNFDEFHHDELYHLVRNYN